RVPASLAPFFFFQAEDGIRDLIVTGVQTCALPISKRIAEQPLELPNAGSVFRNPPGKYAARLIEACGLKGHEIGGARISEKHANFIVNPKGKARASDIEALIEHARDAVKERFGIELVPEVRIIGEAA